MFMQDGLLTTIRKIKERHNKNEQFRKIAKRQATSKEDLECKVRAMTIAFEAIAQQNSELMRVQQQYSGLLEEKDKQIDLKQIENKKYREQLLDAMNKNQQLTIYCRQLANQYTIILNSMKDSEQTALMRQRSAQSKIVTMENQVSHLRMNILGIKNNNLLDESFDEKSKKIREQFKTRQTQKKEYQKFQSRKNSLSKGKRSLSSKSTPKKRQITQQSKNSKKSLVHLLV